MQRPSRAGGDPCKSCETLNRTVQSTASGIHPPKTLTSGTLQAHPWGLRVGIPADETRREHFGVMNAYFDISIWRQWFIRFKSRAVFRTSI